MTSEQIRMMAHAVGLDNKEPEKGVYKAYRNRYAAKFDNDDWDNLVEEGYATKFVDGGGYVWYHLTQKGLDFLSEVKGFKIEYDFDDE